jgi:F-type H+-transporting ATPase subunit c
MIYFAALAIAAGFAVPIAVIGAGIGQGRAVASGLESTARQPGMAGQLLINMIIGLAFIESLVLFALVLVFIFLGSRLPDTNQVLQTIQSTQVSK